MNFNTSYRINKAFDKSHITYSDSHSSATRVQSSRRERVCEDSLKAELSTGRTLLPTAISVSVQASADRLRAADYQAHARARWAKAANRAGAAEAQAATGRG